MRSLLRTLSTAGAAAAALALALSGIAPASATPAPADDPAPQLSVTLTNSEKTVKQGDQVTLTGRVRNLGATDESVRVVLDAPDYVELAAAPGATVDGSSATWEPTIRPGEDTTVTIRATIGKIPSTERRVTTLASVYVGGAPTPVVRTADARFIDGVKDAPASGKAASMAKPKTAAPVLPWIIGGAAVVVVAVAAVGVLLLLRRRRLS